MRVRTHHLPALITVVTLMALGACSATSQGGTTTAGVGSSGAPSPVSGEIPRVAAAQDITMRLADGLHPPTNRWFSGLVFGDEPQAVFPSPLRFAWTGSGFDLGLPVIAASPDAIVSGTNTDVSVDLGADAMTVTAYDAVAITLTATDGGKPVATVTLAQGWPAVAVTAVNRDVTIPLAVASAGDGVWTVHGSDRWGVASGSARAGADGLTIPAGTSAQIYAAPDTDVAAAASWFMQPLTGVSVTPDVAPDATRTTLDYGIDTLLVPPAPVDAGCTIGSYATVQGNASACATSSLTWTVPTETALDALDLTVLSDADRRQLIRLVEADTPSVTDDSAFPDDSYYGAKALYRAAMLGDLASQLGMDDEAATLFDAVASHLDAWTNPTGCDTRASRCVVYDTTNGGYVAREAAFGSEQFNDHHFHYGYLISAAAILARHRTDVIDGIAPVVNALVADIASPAATADVPADRVFDPYWGHSWASGYAPFADGNNQESVSEAMLAWTGVERWAEVTGNPDLATHATWLLSSEMEAARTQWLAPDTSDFPAYTASIVTIVWGDKLDHATWFSDSPSAKLGILAIPASPTLMGLGVSSDRIDAAVAEALPDGEASEQEAPLSGYVLAYSALAGPDQATTARDALLARPLTDVDDGTTRSYLVAWAMVAASG